MHSLDRHTCGTYARSTVINGLSVLCEAVSLVNEWRLDQIVFSSLNCFANCFVKPRSFDAKNVLLPLLHIKWG